MKDLVEHAQQANGTMVLQANSKIRNGKFINSDS